MRPHHNLDGAVFFNGGVMKRKRQSGFTLIELMIGAILLAVGITTLLGAFLGQITLNEHARNLTWAVNDANRVLERMRQQNSGAACASPSAAAPAGFADWDAWLAGDMAAGGGGGKSIQPDPDTNELVMVTSGGADPLEITVAICWRHRERTIGECDWNAGALITDDSDGDGVLESPAMLSTLMTCRK
jgi:prepilin-type N-terminal cleavage/methylation domain-containing protein